MIIHDIANSEFNSRDDLVVELAEAIREVDEQTEEVNRLTGEVESLTSEVNSLKEKNLELLSMIPSVLESKKDDKVEEAEEITPEEVYF